MTAVDPRIWCHPPLGHPRHEFCVPLRHKARVVARRRGKRQSWPVYDVPPWEPNRDMWPPSVGGTCPPHAPMTFIPSVGWSCLERGEALGQLLPDPSDIALKTTALRAFDHVWPTMQTRLRDEMKRERKIMVGTAVGVGLVVIFANAAIKKLF